NPSGPRGTTRSSRRPRRIISAVSSSLRAREPSFALRPRDARRAARHSNDRSNARANGAGAISLSSAAGIGPSARTAHAGETRPKETLMQRAPLFVLALSGLFSIAGCVAPATEGDGAADGENVAEESSALCSDPADAPSRFNFAPG